MKRTARIVGRNRNQVMIGWLYASNAFKFAWPEPVECASEAQAKLAVAKWVNEGIIIGKLPGEIRNQRELL